MSKSWHINRRTALKAAGVSLALPWLEAMGAPKATVGKELPRRMCAIMFPFGIAMPKENAEDRAWGWFPTGAGQEYQLSNVLKPLEPLMDDVSIFQGLSHPRCRAMNGHDTGDTFLTANNLAPVTYQNTISLDQLVAKQIGQETRLPSLTLSTDGGVGPRTRTTTLSYTEKGQPIPALSDPKQIFDRLFGQTANSKQDRRQLESSASILDLVRDQSKSLQRNLGVADRRKLSEYETSIRQVVRNVHSTGRKESRTFAELARRSVALSRQRFVGSRSRRKRSQRVSENDLRFAVPRVPDRPDAYFNLSDRKLRSVTRQEIPRRAGSESRLAWFGSWCEQKRWRGESGPLRSVPRRESRSLPDTTERGTGRGWQSSRSDSRPVRQQQQPHTLE